MTELVELHDDDDGLRELFRVVDCNRLKRMDIAIGLVDDHQSY